MEQEFTEEKRLALLEVFPDAYVIYYDIIYDKTLISGNLSGIYPVPICDGNPYNFATSILLTKPIQTPEEKLRQYCIKFDNLEQKKDLAPFLGWNRDSRFNHSSMYAKYSGDLWRYYCSKKELKRTDSNIITYQEACKIIGREPIKPTLEDMKNYAIECGSVPKCDAVKDFVRANGGKAYENGSACKYILFGDHEFCGCMVSEGKTIITFPDAQKKWGITDPKVEERWMTHEEIFEALGNGALFKEDDGEVCNYWKSDSNCQYAEICLKPDYSKKMEDWDWQEMKVEV